MDVLEQDFELLPGAVLMIELEGRDGDPVGAVEVHLVGEWQESGLLKFAPRVLDHTETFQGSPIHLAGLPPMKGRVTITLGGGRVVSFDVKLPEGETHRRIRL